MLGSSILALWLGAANTSLHDVWLSITTSLESETLTMLREIRLPPRIIAALFVGAALAVSGTIMQGGVTRNPLADPGLLGVTAGANVALAITVAFFPSANYFTIMIACFIGASLGTLLVVGIGSVQKGGLFSIKNCARRRCCFRLSLRDR